MASAVVQSALPFLNPPSILPQDRPALTAEYLEECLEAFDIPPSLASIPGLLERPELLAEQPAAKRRKLNDESTSNQTLEPPNGVHAVDKRAITPPPSLVVPLAPLIEKPFDKSQLVAMNKEGLSRGRAQKHAGDAHHRSPGTSDQHQGILELADALLVYVFSFWCDDQLKGRVVDGVVKPACEKGNWQSTFGMIKFTRSIASEAGKGWEAIVGLTHSNLIEGLILEHLTHHARRQLHNRIDVAQKHRDHGADGLTPGSTGPSPPSSSSQSQNEETEDHIKAFLRLSIDMEAKARCLSAALFARNAPFSNLEFPRLLPELYKRATSSETPLTAQVDLRGGLEGRWSWPIDLANGPNALSHAAAFGRAVLEQVAEQQDLRGWRGVSIRAPDI